MSEALLGLLTLEAHAREAANAAELSFVLVNDTHLLLPYRQAALLVDGRPRAVSGVTSLDADAPFALWLRRALAPLAQAEGGPRSLQAADLPPELAADWAEWLPAHALLLPLPKAGPDTPTLLLARDEPWQEAELALLQRLAAIYGFAWAAHHKPAPWEGLRRRLAARPRWKVWVAGATALALLFPVRLSVLTPAEVVARAPAVIRAPAEGVVERVLARPTQPVAEGDLLVEFDRTTLMGRQEVARKAKATAEAELDQASQQAFFDPKAKGQLAVLKSKVDEKTAELAQIDDLLARSRLTAPRAGVAVLDDPSEWQGRPVTVGERILAVADPADVELEAWLAPADVIALEPGAPVTLFLNTDPLRPVPARLLYVAFEATLQPDGLLAHRVRARIEPREEPPRLGLKGTARLDGDRVPLIYWLLRRPLASIRQWLGL